MQYVDQESIFADKADDDAPTLLRVGVPILAIIIATVVLYLAKDVLLPLATALILSVVLSPIASAVERVFGRVLGAALVVLAGVVAISATIYLVTVEMTAVADEVAGYSDNIGNKLAAMVKNAPPWLRHVQNAVTDIERRVQKPKPGPASPRVSQPVPAPSNFVQDNLKHAAPVLEGVVEGLLVIVLLFFLLYTRRDLRDRFVRLAARARVTVASQAIETAGRTVGHYLLLLALVNLGFGIAIGATLWMIGLPDAALWGLMAFLLRFIPYVGAPVSGLLPALVAFAVFPGWSQFLEVIATFVVLDEIASHLVEPLLIGSGIDISPVAFLVCTMYWAWLWGVPGLLLAVPFTACLKVAGDHIPALNFLALLLGGNRTLENYDDFYRMLLELDQAGARALALRYCEEHGLERTCDDVLTPTLNLAGEERAEDHISAESQQFIIETIRELIDELGARFHGPQSTPGRRILGATPPGEVHNLGLLMLLELFHQAGAEARFAGESKSLDETRELVKSFSPDLLCLSCTLPECLPAAAELATALRRELPHLRIICGGVAALSYPAELLRAGCSQVCATKSQVRRVIQQFAVARPGSRSARTAADRANAVPQA